jgi:hypothetical protein
MLTKAKEGEIHELYCELRAPSFATSVPESLVCRTYRVSGTRPKSWSFDDGGKHQEGALVACCFLCCLLLLYFYFSDD